MKTKRLIAMLAVVLSTCCAGLACPTFGEDTAEKAAAGDRQPASTMPDAAWDGIFTRTNGWTGGDVAGTVGLGDGRILWLFGDSWIGEVADGRHQPGSQMINNSIAIQSLAGKTGVAPATNGIQFHWRRDSDSPKAWIAPLHDVNQLADGDKSAGWYWPTGGGAVVPGPNGATRLVIFLFHIGKRAGKKGVFAFESLGSSMAIVDNASDKAKDSANDNAKDSAEKWQIRQFDIPFAINTSAIANNPKLREINWGVAACRFRDAAKPNAEWLYIYGIRNESPLNRQVLLARARADSPANFDAWQFYSGNDRWSAAAADCAPIAEHGTNELSVERLPGAAPMWIMVHSEPPLGRKIFVRTAARPEGPWTDPKSVYSVPEVDRNSAYFAYAAKGHLELSRPEALLISYVVNSRDFDAMFQDASIYRPRFVRVPLKMFLPTR